MREMVLASQKGGVGKTTTAVNLAAYFAFIGKRTLLVDMDLQGNATTHMGLNVFSLDKTMYDVMIGEMSLADVIQQTKMENLDIAPANYKLKDVETELARKTDRLTRLKTVLAEVEDRYDYVVMDTSPNVGIATKNALIAADTVIIPIATNYFSLGSLRLTKMLLDGIDLDGVQRKYVLTMYYKSNSTEAVVKKVREAFGDKVAKTIIPRAVNLSTAPGFGLPMAKKYPKSAGAIAYYKLAQEALEW